MKLKNYVKMGTVTLLIGLTSCAKNSTVKSRNLNIYQPSTLRLQGNKPVETVDGIYTPQTDEVWHSDKRYAKLERELYNR